MAREGAIGGMFNLFAWTVGIVIASSISQPFFKTLTGAMIGWRHNGKNGGA